MSVQQFGHDPLRGDTDHQSAADVLGEAVVRADPPASGGPFPSTLGTPALPTLPHWETPPADLKAAIREIKAALRARIAASGRTVEEVFAVIEARVAERVAEIAAEKERGETVWPVIDYADIEAGTVTADALAKLHRRGCLIVRGHFPHEQATAWDQGIVDYVESNRFFETYRGPGDDFFGSVGSKPEIYPVYWSPAQMQARQSDRMAGGVVETTHSSTARSGAARSDSPAGHHLDPGPT